MVPQPPRGWGVQLQGPSVLESKVRALKEKMTAGKQGADLDLTSHECSSPKKTKCRRVKTRGVQTPSEGSLLPEAGVVPHAQTLNDGQLDSSVNEEEPARNGDSRPPKLPASGLECWNGQSLWPPEAVWTLPGHKTLPGPSSLQDSSTGRVTPDQPGGPGPCKITQMTILKKGRPSCHGDHLFTGGYLDSTSLTPEEDSDPRTALLGAVWKTGERGALGTGDNTLSLSDRVERNRVLLQEMLKVSGQNLPKVGIPAWTPSLDRATPEPPAGGVDWDSGIPLQDSDTNRVLGPKPEPVLSTRPEEGERLLQHARTKTRTQPLRASHDIVPTIAQGSRDGQRSPAQDPRMTFVYRENLQNGNLSDSSSGESSSGQWPKRGVAPSHVRFKDESAQEAEFRYLQRLQQHQRQVLSSVLQAVGQGPLRSKPDLADYIHRDPGDSRFHRSVGGQDHGDLPVPRPTCDSERKCPACGSCVQNGRPAEGTLGPRILQDFQAADGAKAVPLESCNSHGLNSPFLSLSAHQGLHTKWIQETHIRDTTTRPEERDSALDSTDTSDSCRTDSEETGTSQPTRACKPTQGSSPQQRQRQRGSRPQGDHRWSRKAEMELPGGLQAQPHLSGVDDVERGDEGEGGRGHTHEETPFLREDAIPKPLVLELRRTSLGSQRPPEKCLGSHQAHSEDSCAPCRTAYDMTVSSEPGRPDQVTENHKSLEIVSASSLPQGHAQPSAPHPSQQLAASLSPEGWVPTPPSSRKTTYPKSHRKVVRTGPHRPGGQAEPVDNTLPLPPPRTVVLSPPQTQFCSSQVRHPLPDLSANNHSPLGLQESRGAAAHKGKVEGNPCVQESELSLESHGDGGLPGSVGSADIATVNSTGITLSLTLEEPESRQELQGGLQRTEFSSGGHMPPRGSPVAREGPRPPSAAPSDGNKKRSSSIASALGLKKLFSALGHTSRLKLAKACSYTEEQQQPEAPGPASHSSTPKVKRAPSLQFLHLVSSSHQHRKAASFQNLHALLSGKGDRSSLYLVEEPGNPSAPGRPAKAPPRRALSVEDVGVPSLARTVGRVQKVFPDGTSQLQLQRPPEGTFGFCVAYGNGRRDSGLYVQEMADLDTAKLYSGLLGVGDEILEVNGTKVAGLGLVHIQDLLAHSESLSIRVLRQRPVPQ
ncbi:uncharacterized protein KIAA1614 homolog isoform X3 [Castor canadensis]|uniref:Uncharacterized protein KIAA1614 homolog isoform X3 n=2 Tax=Castor canadensis TaxID=51338 RepID=A0AC58KF77_CASCN